jgi:hypothetical protein
VEEGRLRGWSLKSPWMTAQVSVSLTVDMSAVCGLSVDWLTVGHRHAQWAAEVASQASVVLRCPSCSASCTSGGSPWLSPPLYTVAIALQSSLQSCLQLCAMKHCYACAALLAGRHDTCHVLLPVQEPSCARCGSASSWMTSWLGRASGLTQQG